MIFEIVAFRGASVLKEKSFSVRRRGRVKVQVNVSSPTNPDFHGSDCEGRRTGVSIGQGVSSNPISDSNVASDAEHLDFCLRGIDLIFSPAPVFRTGCTENSRQIAGKRGEAPALQIKIKRPESCYFFLMYRTYPRITGVAEVNNRMAECDLSIFQPKERF